MSFIEFDGIKIFYHIKGQGKPVLFGHSYLWDSNMWNEVTENLKDEYTCITVDLPGHGQSGSIVDLNLEKISHINKTLMLHLGYTSFDLAGLSIGGMWGSILCLDDDVDVQKFIIMNSSLSPEPAESKTALSGNVKPYRKFGSYSGPSY